MMATAGDTNVVLTLGENGMGGGKPRKLKGLVTDAKGQPVEGAEVRLFPVQMPNRHTTDANGAFNVSYALQPWQRQNGNPWVIVRDRAHDLALAQEILDENTNVTVQLEPGLTVKGRVAGPDGQPLSNVQVRLMLQASRMGGEIDDHPGTTDAQGHFTFHTLPVGQDYSVYAMLPGYSQKRQKVEVEWDTNVVEMPPIVLRIAATILAGTVVDAKEKPVAGSAYPGAVGRSTSGLLANRFQRPVQDQGV
jgi:hypothetical protein